MTATLPLSIERRQTVRKLQIDWCHWTEKCHTHTFWSQIPKNKKDKKNNDIQKKKWNKIKTKQKQWTIENKECILKCIFHETTNFTESTKTTSISEYIDSIACHDFGELT